MRGFLGAIVVALAVTSASIGHANPQADELFSKAYEAKKNGRYAEACEKFTQVVQLDPSAVGAMLNLGECHDKLHQLVEALKWYLDAQNYAEHYNEHEFDQAAGEAIRDLEHRIPVIAFEFSSPLPHDGEILVDGKVIALEASARFRVDVGAHTVEVRAPGKKTISEQVSLEETGQHTVHVAFEIDREAERPARQRKLLAYGLAGAAVLFYGGDVTAGLLYRSAYKKDCPQEDNCGVGQTGINNRNDANNLDSAAKIVTTSLFAAGLVASGFAVYLYLTPPKLEQPQHALLVPTVTPDSVGLTFTSAF